MSLATDSNTRIAKRTLSERESFIQRLPDELLIKIFYLWVVDLSRIELIGRHDAEPYLWTSLASVCSRWHRVIYTTPLLWDRVVIDDGMTKEVLTDILMFSRQTLLTVIASTIAYNPDFPLCMKLVLHEMSRIRSLGMKLPQRGYEIIENLSGPFPNLRSLTISYSTHSPFFLPKPPTRELRLSAHFVALESLAIRGFVPKSLNSVLSTHPTLKHVEVTQFQGMTEMCSFLAALPKLPLLETLILTPRSNANDHSNSPSMSSITVPRLQFIHLSALTDPCDWLFLNHLIFPSTARLHVDEIYNLNPVGGMQPQDDHFARIDAIAAKLKGVGVIGKAQPLKSIHITSNKAGDIAIAAHTSENLLPDPSMSHLRLYVPLTRDPTNEHCDLWRLLPLSEVTCGLLDGSIISKKLWERIARRSGSLKILHLPNALSLHKFCGSYLNAPADNHGLQYFPNLEKLFITLGPDDDIPFGTLDFTGWCQYLERRKSQNGRGLKELIIRYQWPFAHERMMRLRQLVDHLEYTKIIPPY